MEQSSYFRSMFGQFREKSDASIELKDIADPKLMGQVKSKSNSKRKCKILTQKRLESLPVIVIVID